MASTNNFKIFDESKTNLLNIADYTAHTQRVNGYAANEEIPSDLFNSILRQNSLLSYQLIEYMKGYVSNTITVEHDMNVSDLATFITTFFNSYFTTKYDALDVYYRKISMGDEEVDGCLLYSYDLRLITLYPPIGTFNNLTHYVVGYYKDGNNRVYPEVKKLEIKEAKNLDFINYEPPGGGQSLKLCYYDLSTLASDVVSNRSKYEILMEIYEEKTFTGNITSNAYKTIIIPLDRLDSLGYHYDGWGDGGLTGNHSMVIQTPNTSHDIFVGLANNYADTQGPVIGKYLMLIDMYGTITNCTINISLRERI